MIYTNIQVQFAIYNSPLFRIWRAWDVPATANYVLAAAPEDAVVTPDYPGFVLSSTAILFTNGRWNYASDDGASSTFGVGDGGMRHRKAGTYRVAALDDLNGKMCVEPKDGMFWEREVVCVPNMEDMTLGPWDDDRYIFVGKGRLVLDSGEAIENTTPFKVTAGESAHVTATSVALALIMWKYTNE